MCSSLFLSGSLDRLDDPGHRAPFCRVQVRSGGFRIGEERVDGYVLPNLEVVHPRAAPLAPAQRREPQLSDAAGSGYLLACQRILCQTVDQVAPPLLGEQLVRLAGMSGLLRPLGSERPNELSMLEDPCDFLVGRTHKFTIYITSI